MRIMIADGDEQLLQSMQQYLHRRGHDVTLATNGLDCIAQLAAFVPDVMVLDYGLKWCGIGGVLATLRQDPVWAEVPVILVADSESEFDSHATANVAIWLRKPFSLSDLLAMILSTAKPRLANAVPSNHRSLDSRQGVLGDNNTINNDANDGRSAVKPRWNVIKRDLKPGRIPVRTR